MVKCTLIISRNIFQFIENANNCLVRFHLVHKYWIIKSPETKRRQHWHSFFRLLLKPVKM